MTTLEYICKASDVMQSCSGVGCHALVYFFKGKIITAVSFQCIGCCNIIQCPKAKCIGVDVTKSPAVIGYHFHVSFFFFMLNLMLANSLLADLQLVINLFIIVTVLFFF